MLSWFCGYVLALAVNGMTEVRGLCAATTVEAVPSHVCVCACVLWHVQALVFAVAHKSQLSKLNRIMVAIFVGYALLAVALLRAVGTSGIVLASTAHMLARIVVSWQYLQTFFGQRDVPFSAVQARPAAHD